MNIHIDAPPVAQCTMIDCAYNMERSCHAKAITIGDNEAPNCDTLCCGSAHVHAQEIHAAVGACKVSTCSFNDDLECTAAQISVGRMNNSVGCLTYAMR